MTETTQATTETTETQTPAAPDLGALSFSDYEAVRKGLKPLATEASVTPAAPAPEKAEQKEPAESAPEGTEETDEPSDEAEATDETEAKADEATNEEAEKPKKKGGFQRRIDKLNAKHAAAMAEAEYWKEQALKGAKAPESKPAVTVPAQADQSTKPKPEAFETHAEWVEAVTDWKVEQKLAAKETEQRTTSLEKEQKAAVKTFLDRREAFKAKHDDYDDVMAEVGDIVASPAITQIIIESDHGPALAYELAKDRAQFERINQLSPLAAARELGRLESRLIPSEAKKPETKKITTAPKPLTPVGSGKATVAKSLDDPNLSFAEYERMRREQIKRRGA